MNVLVDWWFLMRQSMLVPPIVHRQGVIQIIVCFALEIDHHPIVVRRVDQLIFE